MMTSLGPRFQRVPRRTWRGPVMRIGGVPVERCVPFGQEYISGDLARNPYSQGLRRASSWGPTRRRI